MEKAKQALSEIEVLDVILAGAGARRSAATLVDAIGVFGLAILAAAGS